MKHKYTGKQIKQNFSGTKNQLKAEKGMIDLKKRGQITVSISFKRKTHYLH